MPNYSKRDYSVVLMRSERLADQNVEHDVYVAHVSAGNVQAAVSEAQTQAVQAELRDGYSGIISERDYSVVLVADGHIDVLRFGYQL